MTRKTGAKNEQGFQKLRNRAEKSLRKRSAELRESPVEDVQKLIQELRVHQIELEMQNEELRRAQVELAESRDRYSDLYDFAPIGYFTLSEKGMILEVNLAGANLLGSERASLMNKRFSQFVSPGFQDAFYFHRERVRETGTQQICELELRRKDKTDLYAQIQSIVVKGDDGNFIQLRTAVVDITQRKRLEDAVSETHGELERKVVERTAELSATNAKLKEEIEERKRMEEALQQSERELHFLSSQLLSTQENERRRIALELHDSIAQKLVAIRMFLNMNLRAGAGSPPPGASLERIYSMIGECIGELRRVIDGLRPSILEELGVIAAIKAYCEEFQTLNHGIQLEQEIREVETDIPKELKIVLYRVLQEALNNVSKHSQAKTVRVFLRKKEGRIELGIEDDGAGFEVDDRRSQESGQGMGLGSMKERALVSGGSISIRSSKGWGTTVVASWPC